MFVTWSSSLILCLWQQTGCSSSMAGSCRRPERWGGRWPCPCTLPVPGTAAGPARTDRKRSSTPGRPALLDSPLTRSSPQRSRWVPQRGRKPVPPWCWRGDVCSWWGLCAGSSETKKSLGDTFTNRRFTPDRNPLEESRRKKQENRLEPLIPVTPAVKHYPPVLPYQPTWLLFPSNTVIRKLMFLIM